MSQQSTPFACVIGNPVTHSLSPLMHNTWLAAAGIQADYRHQEFPKDGFARCLAQLAENPQFLGANVTLPFKHEALVFAVQQTPMAKMVGAANLLVRTDRGWWADNTDVAGFLAPLHAHSLTEKTALVFGAGGAARAVLLALHEAGFSNIALCNRTDAKAQNLLEELDFPQTRLLPFARRHDCGFAPGLLVNAGSAGMKGFPPLDVDLRNFPRSMLIYDLVYTPLKTPLLLQARIMNMPHIGGLSMLIEQARPSFAALFDQEPPGHLDMAGLLRARLEGRG